MTSRSRSRPPLPGVVGPRPKRRSVRVADSIKNEIATLLLRKIKDPRVQQVTVTTVEVSDDLSRARVYYSVFAEKAAKEAAKGLESAKGFIRSALARELGMRYVPQLFFERDLAGRRQEEMERLLQEIKEEHDGSS